VYIKTLTEGRIKFDKRELKHFLAFFLLLGYILPFYFKTSNQKLAMLNENGNLDYGTDLITHIKVLHTLLYIPFILVLLNKFRGKIRDSYSPRSFKFIT